MSELFYRLGCAISAIERGDEPSDEEKAVMALWFNGVAYGFAIGALIALAVRS